MKKVAITIFLLSLTLVGCTSTLPLEEEVFTNDFFAMDTIMTVTTYGPHGQEALESAIAEIERIESLFSTNIVTSDIAKINQNKTHT